MVFLGGMGPQGGMGNKDLPAPLDLLDPLAPKVGGPSTPGGGRATVLRQQALSYSTLASLEGTSTMYKGEGLIVSACPRIQSTAETSDTAVECMEISYMAQSIKAQYKDPVTMMYHVLCAMCLPDPL